jgi:hypothetical protein
MAEHKSIEIINESFKNYSTHLPNNIEEVRQNIITAMEEHIIFGGRVRPLLFDGKLCGYMRGISSGERSWIHRMYEDQVERLKATFKVSTSLSDSQVRDLTSLEIRRLILMLHKFTKADSSLFPWVSPFTTTVASERLWVSDVRPPKEVAYPEGVFKILAPSDIGLHWSYMAYSREDSKESLRSLTSASLIVRAYIGKHAQQLTSDIQGMSKALQPNIAMPWTDMGVGSRDFDPDDGWGHTHQDSSVEGLMRELNGMLNDDKHEQLMRAIAERDRMEAEKRKAKIRQMQNRVEGVTTREAYVTPEEMARRVSRRKEEDKIKKESNFKSRTQMLSRGGAEYPNDRSARTPWDIEV